MYSQMLFVLFRHSLFIVSIFLMQKAFSYILYGPPFFLALLAIAMTFNCRDRCSMSLKIDLQNAERVPCGGEVVLPCVQPLHTLRTLLLFLRSSTLASPDNNLLMSRAPMTTTTTSEDFYLRYPEQTFSYLYKRLEHFKL